MGPGTTTFHGWWPWRRFPCQQLLHAHTPPLGNTGVMTTPDGNRKPRVWHVGAHSTRTGMLHGNSQSLPMGQWCAFVYVCKGRRHPLSRFICLVSERHLAIVPRIITLSTMFCVCTPARYWIFIFVFVVPVNRHGDGYMWRDRISVRPASSKVITRRRGQVPRWDSGDPLRTDGNMTSESIPLSTPCPMVWSQYRGQPRRAFLRPRALGWIYRVRQRMR